MVIKVHTSGFLTTVQDIGRSGYEKFGVPTSGPMDRYALQAANLLVSNPLSAAGLEIGVDGPVLSFDEDCLVAVTGVGFEFSVEGRRMPLWTAVFIRRGSYARIKRTSNGNWAYLAVSGGIKTESVLGSRSTYIKGGFGGHRGAPLNPGDTLPTEAQVSSYFGIAGREIPEGKRPAYNASPEIEVILGPQEHCFTEKGIQTFLSSTYVVTVKSDRMGYRLEGPKIDHQNDADILSDGMLFGSVQVPASGQPIVMMSEHPTTGGYTKIATVVSADLPILAQCEPGISQVRFKETTVDAAQRRYRRMLAWLDEDTLETEEDALRFIV
jgi:antagonist of KipI